MYNQCYCQPMPCPCGNQMPQQQPKYDGVQQAAMGMPAEMMSYQHPHQFETCKQVMEQPVSCTQEYHHHHRVEHVVPVTVKHIHCHHNHHQYVVDKKDCQEAYCMDHGIRQEDWCALALNQCPCPTKY